MYRVANRFVAPDCADYVKEGQRIFSRAFSASPHIFAGAKSILLSDREKPTQLYQIYSGWAARQVHLNSDQRSLTGFYLPGDILGLDGIVSSRLRDTVAAQMDMSYQAISLKTVWQLIDQHPPCTYYLMDLLAREKEAVDDLAVTLSRCSAEVRIAAFLTRIFDRLNDRQTNSHTSFRVPLTQQDIGDHLGLTMVHVNRVLKELRTRGAVVVRNHTAVILDLELLRQIASSEDKTPVQRPERTQAKEFFAQLSGGT